ncbi:hypothetical protein ACWGR4_30820 [Embleya sp. NPDC055664]
MNDATPAGEAAVERLARAADTRDRIARDLGAAASTDERRNHRGALRVAATELHAAVLDGHRAGVPPACPPPAAPRPWQVTDTVCAHGTAHPTTQQAIAAAHAYGVSPISLGRATGITPARINDIVRAAPTTRSRHQGHS